MRLDNTARMNTPGTAPGNWKWRMGDGGVWVGLLDKEAQVGGVGCGTAHMFCTAAPASRTVWSSATSMLR